MTGSGISGARRSAAWPPAAATPALGDGPTIDSLRVSVYTIPTDAPESDGTIAWDRTDLQDAVVS